MPGSEPVLNNYLIVGALLFTLGTIGFLTRRNLIVMFLCAELMLQGVSLTLVAFGSFHGTWNGQVFSIFSLSLAAAEAGIALALFVVLFKRNHSLDVSIWQDLREPDQPAILDEPVAETPDEQHWPHLTPAGLLPGEPHAPQGHASHHGHARPTLAQAPVATAGGSHGN
ncbi:MAG: NADH-quinone oxidoreductase subunit NuoK [Planctomycetes bacterium]|nr:NADH-quinone oxidoreductase subunit NuoK [Planctomycetota bacterium]